MNGPYLLPTEATFLQWGADVKAAGGVVTMVPNGLNAGAYAARFPEQPGLPSGSYTYVVAPVAVLLWEFGQMTDAEVAQLVAGIQSTIESTGANVASNLGDVVGALGSGVGSGVLSALEGWWWLLAAGGLALYVATRTETGRKAARLLI